MAVSLLSSEASESLSYLDLGVPVAYVYGPAKLILSDYPFSLDRAACNRNKVNRSAKVKQVISEKGRDQKNVPAAVNCAATTAANMKELLGELNHRDLGKRFAVNTLDLPYALQSVIKDVWDVNLTEKVKADMVVKSAMDMFGVPFNKFLEKKGDSMSEEMKELANEFMEFMYEELELEEVQEEDDGTGFVRNLKRKKARMTDWPFSD